MKTKLKFSHLYKTIDTFRSFKKIHLFIEKILENHFINRKIKK